MGCAANQEKCRTLIFADRHSFSSLLYLRSSALIRIRFSGQIQKKSPETFARPQANVSGLLHYVDDEQLAANQR